MVLKVIGRGETGHPGRRVYEVVNGSLRRRHLTDYEQRRLRNYFSGNGPVSCFSTHESITLVLKPGYDWETRNLGQAALEQLNKFVENELKEY
ncbi:MAG TPA: hypothetical protein VD907_03125 [Verrucomicrobiae bacterium]|nr:hypothetical protein [Verrucomicrobiae bacterium]